jgi:flagella basal body P-ring formation protein FlgA
LPDTKLVKKLTTPRPAAQKRASNHDWHASCKLPGDHLDQRRWTLSRNTLTRLAAGAVAVSLAAQAQAQQGNEDWQTIDVLTEMVANAMGRSATPVDRRIKLARCPEQASVTAVDAQTLAVRCASLGWRLRVPMTGPADASPATASFARPAASAPVIRRGDNVRVTIETESYSISYAAVATQDGRVGETIALRGNDAKSTLSATVTGPGRARLDD